MTDQTGTRLRTVNRIGGGTCIVIQQGGGGRVSVDLSNDQVERLIAELSARPGRTL